MSSKRHFLGPLLESGSVNLTFQLERTGFTLAEHLELASDSKARTRGLLGRESLAEGSVLIIAPCNAVHTFFMRFTIDVVFADRGGKVVKVCRQLKPWRIGTGLGAFAALEFAAGTADRSGIVKGDRVKVVQK
jgi:uncharacterized membrane protein (UPF0127 family)